MSKIPGTGTWYSAGELADMKLPLLPSTKKGIRERAERDKWPRQQRIGRGGGYEYQPPAPILKAIKDYTLSQIIGDQHGNNAHTVNATSQAASQVLASAKDRPTKGSLQVSKSVPAALKDWQRQTAEARAAICAEVKRLSQIVGADRAIRKVIELAKNGELEPHLQQMVAVANARAGQDRSLSRGTIYRWLKDQDKGVAYLAPKAPEVVEMPAWAGPLLKLMANPQKPTLKYCLQVLPDYLPASADLPSYWAADRFLKKLSNVERQRGRMGSRDIKNIRPFVRRDTTQMWPGDAYTADGHTFDAEVAHPDHGRPFRPEITTVIDIATRRVVGWSVGLAESTWAVLDALRHACCSSGIPSVFYVDNGSGYKNATMSHEATGFMARLSITLTHSTPYNSQARGIIERAHQTLWVKGAKQLPTYMGADMDAQAKQKVFKLTRASIKQTGTSKLLMPWNIFVGWCQEQVDQYNSAPHRSLPTIRDSITGNKRHQCPNEAWAQAVEEGKSSNWAPVMVEPSEADDLFRPYKEAKVSRGEIRLHNNIYFHPELEHYHGDTMRVGYDLHDAQRVWVRNKAGQLVCVAEFEANKRSYFPESFLQQAAEKRAKGRIKRAEAKIEEALEELSPPAQIEHQPTFDIPNTPQRDRLPSTPDVQIVKNGCVGEVVGLVRHTPARPSFETDASKYKWLMQNPREIRHEDESWIDWYRTTSEFEDLFGDREVATR